MKTITNFNDYKTAIKTLGREIDAYITYTNSNNVEVELSGDVLNSITPHYEGGILKSVMKQLDVDSNQDIPLDTIIECKFGVKVRNNNVLDYRDNYDYISFGNYIVYSSEKQEDTKSYKLVCYDKMLSSMKDYTKPFQYVATSDSTFSSLKDYYEYDDGYILYNGDRTGNPSTLGLYEKQFVAYPITIRNYLSALCDTLGLTFASISDDFANYDKEVPSELFLDANGDSLEYTFRDVLDQIAEVSASTICINNDDELEVRYITDSEDTIDEEFLKDINVNFGQQYGPINTITFKRSAGADAISVSRPSDLPNDQKNEIAISDNQFLNDNNRANYIDAILDELYGLTYYINDYASTGITYYDLCDRYNVSIDGNTYSCVMLNDEIQITQGLVENVHTDMPDASETDYNTTTKDDRNSTRANIIVDKVNGTISSITSLAQQVNVVVNGKVEYKLTEDTTYQEDKTYYTYNDVEDEYEPISQYTNYVGEREGSPHTLGLYQQSITYTYIASDDDVFQDTTYYYDDDGLKYKATPANQELYEYDGEQYIASIDTDFDLTKAYYIYDGEDYITATPALLELYEKQIATIDYVATLDETFQEGKDYFTQVYATGGVIPANTIYEEIKTPSLSEQIEGFDEEIDKELGSFDGKITGVEKSVTDLQTTTYSKKQINSIARGLGHFLTEDTTFNEETTYYTKSGNSYVEYTGARTGSPVELGLYEYGYIEAVVSETGKFDKDGLLIQKEDAQGAIISDTSGRFNEKGVQIKTKNGEEIFFSGYVDDNRFGTLFKNTSIVFTKNMVAKGFTEIAEHGRFESYAGPNSEPGVGFFII